MSERPPNETERAGYTRPVPARSRPPQQPAPPYAQQPTRPSESGLYLPWWSLVVMVATVGLASLLLVLVMAQLGQPQAPGDQAPRVQVITSQPTLSQDFVSEPAQASFGTNPTRIPQAQPSPTVPLPTPIPSPTLPAGEFAIGVQVRVVGVGTNGLNIRSSPGYEGALRFLAYDDDIFAVVEGPQTADGMEWWRIEDPDDPNRYGWAARNFLTVIGP